MTIENVLRVERNRMKKDNIVALAKALTDAMDTCHICKGTLIIDDEPSHCEDCSSDCESHDEPNCRTIRELHHALVVALKGVTDGR